MRGKRKEVEGLCYCISRYGSTEPASEFSCPRRMDGRAIEVLLKRNIQRMARDYVRLIGPTVRARLRTGILTSYDKGAAFCGRTFLPKR